MFEFWNGRQRGGSMSLRNPWSLLVMGWILLMSATVGAQPQHLFPRYLCETATADLFCQSFQKNSDGVQLLAAPGAVTGVAVGQLTHNGSRQSLIYKAGRTGGPVLQFGEQVLPQVSGDDFFYEVLLRPFANSTTDRETVYLTLTPADGRALYAVGLKAGSSIYTSKVELVTLAPAQVSVLKEAAVPVVLGSQEGEDGQWYLLRVERREGSLRVYLQNQLVLSDPNFGRQSFRHAGIWSYNRSFELDYLRFGRQAAVGPQLLLQGLENQPLRVYQQQESGRLPWQVLGVDATDMRWSNLTPTLVQLESDSQSFRLHYLRPGMASVMLQSQSQPHIFKQIQLQIEPAPSFPSHTVAIPTNRLSPLPGSTVAADSLLSIKFASPIQVGSSGAVRIYQLQAGQAPVLVDEIRTGNEFDHFGSQRIEKYRTLRRPLIWSQDQTLYIKPHSHRLAPGQRYQVELSAGLVEQENGQAFLGVGLDAQWIFATKPAPAAKPILQVGPEHTADFATVQGALNYVMALENPAIVQRIELAAGIYHEPLYLTGIKQLTIAGAGAELSRIEFTNYDSLNSGLGVGVKPVVGHSAGGRSVFFVDEVGQLTLQHLSIKNLHQRQKDLRNQAETIYFNSTGRLLALHSHFISEQDTLMLKGTSYFRQCLIAGNVDFIWGQNYLSLFEQNEIRSVGNSVPPVHKAAVEGSYILQARTISPEAPGFIFIKNRFTHVAGPTGRQVAPQSTFIARSAGRPSYYDQVLLIDNQLGNHIAAQGWAGPQQHEPAANPAQATAQSGWREYGSTDLSGQPLPLQQRQYGKLLTKETLPYQDATDVLKQHWPDFDWALLQDRR